MRVLCVQEIDDPSDEKPADWVDEAQIKDPEAVKPDDWDESQPATIPDPNAEKPKASTVARPLVHACARSGPWFALRGCVCLGCCS